LLVRQVLRSPAPGKCFAYNQRVGGTLVEGRQSASRHRISLGPLVLSIAIRGPTVRLGTQDRIKIAEASLFKSGVTIFL